MGLEAADRIEAVDVGPALVAPAPPSAASRSFEDVYRDDYARMVRVAHLLTGSNETAEDIVQDAFVKLYDRFDTLGDVSGYLYRAVVNSCWNRHRHLKVVERLQHLTVPATVAGVSEIDETLSALRILAPRRRAVVVLRYYADLRLEEIAQILGCRLGTVKSALHRALAELKEAIPR